MTNNHNEIEEILKQRTYRRTISRLEISFRFAISERKVREIIADLQRQGKPIVSLEKGYFWGDKESVEQYCKREKNMAISILEKLTHLKPKTVELIEQLQLI